MPTKQRHYPAGEPVQVTWLTSDRNKIATHGPTCGIAAGEVTDTQADLNDCLFLLNMWHPALQSDVKEGTTYKTLIATGSGATVALPAASAFTPPTARSPGVLNRFSKILEVSD